MSSQRGFSYISVLILIVLMGLILTSLSTVWQTLQRRDREKELLFIGNQYRNAIRLYYESTPGTVKQYPMRLQDLLEDSRLLSRQRYLRKLYADPVTGEPNWGIVRAPNGGILGIYSLSEQSPLKVNGFKAIDASFAGKSRYRDWEFSYVPPPSVGPSR